MLIAAIIALVLGAALGGSRGAGKPEIQQLVDLWRKGIKKHIKDDEERNNALAVVDGVQQQLLTVNQVALRAAKDSSAINRNYSATLEELTAPLESVSETLLSAMTAITEAGPKLRETIDEDDYDEILAHIREKFEHADEKDAKQDAKAAKKAKKAQATAAG